MRVSMPEKNSELNVPPGPWKLLSEQDKALYINLRNRFHQMQKSFTDHCSSSFSNEIKLVIEYIDSSSLHREERAAVVGIAISGPIIAVNTRQLMSLLGRCKSSINGSLQNLGYQSLRSKTKARECVLSVLPSFEKDVCILRQWTARCATDNAKFCFCSKYPPHHIPVILATDLIEEKARPKSIPFRPPLMPSPYQVSSMHPVSAIQSQPVQPLTPTFVNDQQILDHPVLNYDFDYPNEGIAPIPELTQSFSVDYLPSLQDNDFDLETNPYQMTHSSSAYFHDINDISFDI